MPGKVTNKNYLTGILLITLCTLGAKAQYGIHPYSSDQPVLLGGPVSKYVVFGLSIV